MNKFTSALLPDRLGVAYITFSWRLYVCYHSTFYEYDNRVYENPIKSISSAEAVLNAGGGLIGPKPQPPTKRNLYIRKTTRMGPN